VGSTKKIVGKGPKYDKKLVVVYSRDEMDTLLAACTDPYFLTVLKILQMTGLREAEATHLTWGEVDLKKRLIHGLRCVQPQPDLPCYPKQISNRASVSPSKRDFSSRWQRIALQYPP
jgi:hypothetical protein